MHIQSRQEKRKALKLAEAVEAVMAGNMDTILVPTIELKPSMEEQVLA